MWLHVGKVLLNGVAERVWLHVAMLIEHPACVPGMPLIPTQTPVVLPAALGDGSWWRTWLRGWRCSWGVLQLLLLSGLRSRC